MVGRELDNLVEGRVLVTTVASDGEQWDDKAAAATGSTPEKTGDSLARQFGKPAVVHS